MQAPLFATLPPLAASASIARELVICACREWHHEALADDLTLLVTELVANAVRHAGTEMVVRVIPLPHGIRLEVHDLSTRPLRPRPATLVEEGGRGLILVDALSSRYGVEGEASGKLVWAELIAKGCAVREEAPGAARRGPLLPRI